MYCIFLTILILLPPTLGLVDCLNACKQCKEHEKPPEILEVYCAMCKECIDRRKERRGQVGKQAQRQAEGPAEGQENGLVEGQAERLANIYNLDEFPDYCPLPPPCEPDLEEITTFPQPQKLKSTTSTTTTSTTTTTTRRPCPTAPPCKKRVPPPPPCFPCMPMCPCPYPLFPLPPRLPSDSPHHHLADSSTTSTTKTTGYLYVYVGVPKNVLEKIQN